MKKISIADGPGTAVKQKTEKGHAFRSVGAQASTFGNQHAQDAFPTAVLLDEKAGAVENKALVEAMGEIMGSSNGEAKKIFSKIDSKTQFQIIKSLAEIYSNEEEYDRRNKAMMVICCSFGIGWEMVGGWRSRCWDTGRVTFTESEKEYMTKKFVEIQSEIDRDNRDDGNIRNARNNGGIK